MNQLDPELKRLIRWSRAADPSAPEEAAFGTAGRIASRWGATIRQAEPAWWPRLQLATAGMSLLCLAAGLLFWSNQAKLSANAYDFSPAYQLVARNIAP